MSIKKPWIYSLVAVAALAGVGFVAYRQGQDNSAKPKQSQTQTTKKKVAAKPKTETVTKPTTTTSIQGSDPAGLFHASQSRKLTDFTPWTESTVMTVYKDFNDDGVIDAFVWATLPGTAQYSFAAVWTTDTSGQPKELWYVPDELVMAHSTWLVNSNSGLKNTSLNVDGSTNQTQTFHWQVSTTGSGFVLEPGA